MEKNDYGLCLSGTLKVFILLLSVLYVIQLRYASFAFEDVKLTFYTEVFQLCYKTPHLFSPFSGGID